MKNKIERRQFLKMSFNMKVKSAQKCLCIILHFISPLNTDQIDLSFPNVVGHVPPKCVQVMKSRTCHFCSDTIRCSTYLLLWYFGAHYTCFARCQQVHLTAHEQMARARITCFAVQWAEMARITCNSLRSELTLWGTCISLRMSTRHLLKSHRRRHRRLSALDSVAIPVFPINVRYCI